uniref:Uncharacterized protein n=1 Tax=Meloidogyne javanica TaxID=6303 RepID=A0A915MXK0_MELJA
MFFKIFFKAFIAFYFIGFAPPFVEGMHPPRGRVRTGGRQGHANLNTFSLTELSFLIKILDRIELVEVYNNSASIERIFRQKGADVLAEAGLAANDRIVNDFRQKIREVLIYFTQIINTYQEQLQNDYSEYLDRETRLLFINRRIEDYRQSVDQNEYNQFIGDHGLDINEFVGERDWTVIPASLWNIGDIELRQLEVFSVIIFQKEMNLYLFYKLHVLARRLIVSFIQESSNAYIALFEHAPALIDDDNVAYTIKISIVGYIAIFDYYELTANSLHDMLENQAFSIILDTDNLFRDLRSDELELTLGGYPVHCHSNPDYENINNIGEIERYLPLIYTFRGTDSREITNEEFAQFAQFRIQGRPNNTYNLYQLFNSQYVSERQNLQAKLEQFYINPQLIAQINNNALVYDNELGEPLQIREGVTIPPQIREVVYKKRICSLQTIIVYLRLYIVTSR